METDWLFEKKPALPLIVFRISFGAVLFFSTLRFLLKGWVKDFYISPLLHFPFFGLEWLKPLPGNGMYLLYLLMIVFAFGICTGFFYRWAATGFLLLFSYCGMLDKTYYLNHYYLITLMSLLLAVVPANQAYSLDVKRRAVRRRDTVPAWTILLFQVQLAVIYFCAGLSKLTPEWLFEAMPLKIWLHAKGDLPLIGWLLEKPATAYVFSWFGALFDLGIVFLLRRSGTRALGYFLVLLFHGLTACLFQIGMFPWLMITATLIFFPAGFWIRLGTVLKNRVNWRGRGNREEYLSGEPAADPGGFEKYYPPALRRRVAILLTLYFLFQILIPFRFLLYPGKLLWTEEGYRFSWRVMLMEKSGTAYFYLTDPATGLKKQISNRAFLTAYQERMMETQPDMMQQYAQKLRVIFQGRGIASPVITVESYVSLNGHRSRLFVDSSVNLATVPVSCFGHPDWIRPFTQNPPVQ